eukprot:gnl/MRDRNA2_/MRDRNA2_73829_c0_seq1.p1 gnl/MRDRNA2_/MRDRNA2_73829_c0~~gnl/MRDRNA2_/MRDRNA2_73829_c0_seq1.p1  ORF type:complete len:354 (+),score=78.90 gnl/MRDRNA2_/MRDRNA2_73829_c0_seq1:97-1158(+)
MSNAANGSPAFQALVQASAGACGGIFATVVLMPVEVVKTRVSVSQSGDSAADQSILSLLFKISKDEGLSGLFRGVNAKSAETGSRNFVYFYIYDALNAIAKRKAKISAGQKLVLGYVAAVVCTVLTSPLEVLATRVQVQKGKQAEGVSQLLYNLFKSEGIGGLYKGLGFNILLCINPAIVNTCFDRMKDQLLQLKKNKQMTAFEAFVIGAVAKAIATFGTFPLVRLKTMIQAGKEPKAPEREEIKAPPNPDKVPGVPSMKRKSSTQIMLRTMSFNLKQAPAEQGLVQRFLELYRGLGAALFKSVLQAGLLYMTKDQVEGIVIKVFNLSAEMLRRRSGQLKLGAWSGRPLPDQS